MARVSAPLDWPSHYTSPEFFLEPYWHGKNPFAVLAYDGDRIVAVLTGLHEGNQVVSGLLSRPQVCFDRATDISSAAQTLARGLLEGAGSAELITFYSWSRIESLQSMGFRVRPMQGDIILDLTRGPDTLLREMHMSQRKNVRIAMRKGVEVSEASTEEDFCAYYDVHRAWLRTTRKKINEDQISLPAAMEAYKLRKNRRLFLARHEGKVVAAASVRFAPGGLLEYSGNPSLEVYFSLKPNDLLKWKVIEWRYAQGFPRFSLGGAHRFHLKSGGTIVPIYRYRLDRTWFHRYELREAVTDTIRTTLRRVPPLDKAVRRLLGKEGN